MAFHGAPRRGATTHYMGIAGSNAYWLACATFRRGAYQAGCTIQLSNDSNKGLMGTPGHHNMNPNSQGSCMTEQIILCSRSKGITLRASIILSYMEMYGMIARRTILRML